MKKNIENIVNFFFELKRLKQQVSVNWWKLGYRQQMTVNEDVFSTVQIAYVLANMEGDVDLEKLPTVLMIQYHNNTRSERQEKVASYCHLDDASKLKNFTARSELLSESILRKWKLLFDEFTKYTNKEFIIAEDACWLEQAFRAKKYVESGHHDAQNWINYAFRKVKSESAKTIISTMESIEFSDWYAGLRQMTYDKLKRLKMIGAA